MRLEEVTAYCIHLNYLIRWIKEVKLLISLFYRRTLFKVETATITQFCLNFEVIWFGYFLKRFIWIIFLHGKDTMFCAFWNVNSKNKYTINTSIVGVWRLYAPLLYSSPKFAIDWEKIGKSHRMRKWSWLSNE